MRNLLTATLITFILLIAATVSAQPGCRTRILPEPLASAFGIPTGLLGAEIFYAEPPIPAELWGRVTYPLGYHYPDNATNVGLMYFTAKTPYFWGDLINSWYGGGYDPNRKYVLTKDHGPTLWIEDGIIFEGYHIMGDVLGPKGEENTWDFRATQHFGAETSGPMSIVMQPHEQWTIGVNNMRYKDTIMTQVQLQLRECFVPGDIPGGGK